MDIDRRRLHPGVTPAKGGSLIPSSSPAFATPLLPIRPPAPAAAGKSNTVLPIEVPIVKFRPLAVRVFTKRHNLNLTSQALQTLATFVGKHCGTGWLQEGLAEKVLEEVARKWKKNGGAFIVDGDSKELQAILKELGLCMVGGKISQPASSLNRQTSFGMSSMDLNEGSPGADSGVDVSMNGTQESGDEEISQDPRQYLKIISPFDQPRLTYNPSKRHFEKIQTRPTLFPDASTRTAFFKQRYHMVHQRLMRNESFQTPSNVPIRRTALQRSASSFLPQQSYKLSNITDLLGRHGTSHILLGLLTVAPAGHYAISDLTGSIMLDLSLAAAVPEGAWFVPGMIVIVDGTYEEEGIIGGAMVGNNTGIGGTIGGKFVASTIAGPPSEKRAKTLGLNVGKDHDDFAGASGFGWVDFLGVGSEKSIGPKMRHIEGQVLKKSDVNGRGRIVAIGELNLDIPENLEALRKILSTYESDEPGATPMTFILLGNFVSTAGMARYGSAGSIEYKEYFDVLSSVLSDYPRVLAAATFIFVPGNNDPWASSFSASATTTIPRQALPTALTSRVRKAFQSANSEKEKTANTDLDGDVVFTSNPTRLSLFGPAQEMMIMRDDIINRIRRHAVTFPSDLEEGSEEPEDEFMDIDAEAAEAEAHQPERPEDASIASAEDMSAVRKLVKLIVDQAYLSPFSNLTRPTLWDYAPCLHMVPLPTSIVLMDPEAPPFALGYEGCFVINPGKCLVDNRKGQARWAEYDASTKRGKTMHINF